MLPGRSQVALTDVVVMAKAWLPNPSLVIRPQRYPGTPILNVWMFPVSKIEESLYAQASR